MSCETVCMMILLKCSLYTRLLQKIIRFFNLYFSGYDRVLLQCERAGRDQFVEPCKQDGFGTYNQLIVHEVLDRKVVQF